MLHFITVDIVRYYDTISSFHECEMHEDNLRTLHVMTNIIYFVLETTSKLAKQQMAKNQVGLKYISVALSSLARRSRRYSDRVERKNSQHWNEGHISHALFSCYF
mmetsp:Transcript_31770/g.66102  ORF Transcript_31770/g.66102 Transcript_31770/m.66102 type:complete len:105 (+) Transcript_31770:88-402(+)